MPFLSDPVNFIANWLQNLLLGWGLSGGLVQVIMFVLGAAILTIGPLLVTIGLIVAERKLGGRFQDRLGPNRVGPWGIFQTIADMLKIFVKEYITPIGADWVPYNLAPILAVGAVIATWAVIPFAPTVFGVNVNVGVLYLIAVGGLGELGIIMAGFGSNNKFALLGGFRAVALLVSYEIPMVITLLIPVMFTGSMGMNDIAATQKVWFIVLAPVAALIFFITSIAENGRAPFDLTEADSEIVAGFNIEYSGLKFGMFFVGDFLHAFTSALIFSTIFLGGWQGLGAEQYPILGFIYLAIKTVVVYLLLLTIRFSLPRFRIDQMMAINWKFLTPLSLAALVVTAIVDKLAPPGFNLIRVGLLIGANIVLWIAADRLLAVYRRRKKLKLKDVSGNYPLARPPETPAQDVAEVEA